MGINGFKKIWTAVSTVQNADSKLYLQTISRMVRYFFVAMKIVNLYARSRNYLFLIFSCKYRVLVSPLRDADGWPWQRLRSRQGESKAEAFAKLWVNEAFAQDLKVHKHEIILNFFLTEIKSLYALCKFSKKISLLFLRFSPEFRCSNISAVTEHTRNQIFFERYPKIFFFKIFTLVLLNRFLDGFSNF